MTLPRSLTWEYLLPSETVFAGSPLPGRLDPREHHPSALAGEPYLLVHRLSGHELPRLERYSGLIAINCSSISALDLRRAGFASIHQYTVIPSLEDARLFIPISDRPAARASFDLIRPRVSWRGRLELGFAKRVAGTGLLPILRRGDRLLIAQRTLGPLEQSVLEALAQRPIHLALTSGGRFPDERRKPALAAIGKHGRALAFGNLADAKRPRELLRHQAEVLHVLESRYGPEWHGPRLLQAGEVGRAYFTLQSAVKGQPCGVELTPGHHAFLTTLTGGPARPAAETHLLRSLDASLPSTGGERKAFQIASELLAGCRFDQTVLHGDFQPENLRNSENGVVAFDWEHGDIDGLPLFDAIYHVIHTSFLRLGCSVDQTLRRLSDHYQERCAGFTGDQTRAISILGALSLNAQLIGEPSEPGSLPDQLISLASKLADPA